MTWTIFRPNISHYFSSEFRRQEQALLQSLPGVSFVHSWEEGPRIVITSTETPIASVSPKYLGGVDLIVHPNSGYEKFSKQFVSDFSGFIVVGNNIRTQAVLQYILSCLFQRYAYLPTCKEWDIHRSWNRKLFKDLHFLILGLGHVGHRLYRMLSSLESHCHIYDPYKGYPTLPTPKTLKQINSVISVCSHNPHNTHLIDKVFLDRLNSEVTLINPARGKLIKEEDLIQFLQQNPKAFAFLDVFDPEPFSKQRYKHLSNVALTSHVAGVYREIDQEILDFEYKIIKDFIDHPNIFEKHHLDLLLKPNHIIE